MSQFTHCKVASPTPEMKAQILRDSMEWILAQTELGKWTPGTVPLIRKHVQQVLKATN